MNSKVIVSLIVVVVLISGYMFYSNQKVKENPIPTVVKPKAPKPVLEVKDIEVTGVVQKIPQPGIEKTFMYCIKNAENLLVVLFAKVDGKEIDWDQYVGKEITAKGKGTVELKKNMKGEDFKSTRFKQITAIELKGEVIPASDKIVDEIKKEADK